jgi:cytidylate kinase
MIVVIDGPAGAGKSSAARALARRLGFRFLDTGAMYRAVALAAVRQSVKLDDREAISQLARRVKIELRDDRLWLDGEDVTAEVRSSAITSITHYAADNPGVREHLVKLQRETATGQNIVSEGRDQGTVVFPEAQVKIFLTASPTERARRRLRDLEARGEGLPLETVLEHQNLRDERDRNRQTGPLVPAADAIQFSTDGLEPEEVVDQLEALARARMPAVE